MVVLDIIHIINGTKTPGSLTFGDKFRKARKSGTGIQQTLFPLGDNISGMKNDTRPDYSMTIKACFVAYIIQAIVNNFVSLLFVIYQNEYGMPLSQITLLITVNFTLQLCIDSLSAVFVDRIGYRVSIVIAHIASLLGLVMLAFLPDILPSPFFGLLIAVSIYAIGGGLVEVLISPIVEACPTDNKAGTMSLLHSFYNWGSAGVIVFTTLFLKIFGSGSWKLLAVLWAIIPLVNGIIFTRVPIAPLVEDERGGMKIKELLGSRLFWVLALLMMCSGASEHSVAQWASTIAEKGLNISKTLGDLAGPAIFALMQGLSRLLYAKHGEKLKLDSLMLSSALLCIASYLLLILSPNPIFSLIGMAVSGFAVGIMWPGTFSLSSMNLERGGTAMFALLALAGDFGCAAGPTLAGFVADSTGENLKLGVAASLFFPVLMAILLFSLVRKRKHN